MHSAVHSESRSSRLVFHSALTVTRFIGALLIALGVLGMPQMSFLTRRLAVAFGLISATALIFAGVGWLICVEVFLHFFDRYLSRN